MRQERSLLLLLGFALVLSGCAAHLVRKGDASLLSDDPDMALRHYRSALDRDPGLSGKPEFVAKFNRAQCGRLHRQGVALVKRKEYEQAVLKLSQCLEIDPKFSAAQRILSEARRGASRVRYDKAMRYADKGKLNEAIYELEKALELDPTNSDAREALESVSKTKADRNSKAGALYLEADALGKEKRWRKAAELLRTAIALNGSYLPGRIGYFRSRKAMKDSGAAWSRGCLLLKRRRLDEAIVSLRESLEIWPFHPEAPDMLGQAEAQRKLTDELYAEAEAAGKREDWPTAAAAAYRGREVYPYHRPTSALYEKVRHKACDVHTRRGEELLAKGSAEQAEAHWLLAVRYVPDTTTARHGLAGIYVRRGTAAAKTNHWGSAVLSYMDAAHYVPTKDNLAKLADAREKILARIAFGISLDVAEGHKMEPGASEALKTGIRARLAAKKPSFVSLAGESGKEDMLSYAASVTLRKLDVRQRRTRSESRTYRYAVDRDVPNPEIPKLRLLLQSAQRELSQERREYRRRCLHCGATGRTTCPKCKGDRKRMKHCPTCKGRGRVRCPWCEGRVTRATRRSVREKQRIVDDLRSKLERTPATIVKSFPADWDYTVHHYEKTGMIGLGLRVSDGAGRGVADFTVGETFHQKDETIDGANPAIGLRADPLKLASDTEVTRRLINAASDQAAGRILVATVNARCSRVRSAVQKSERSGKPLEATEARVDLVHLLEFVSPKEAGRLLDDLRAEGRIRPAPR